VHDAERGHTALLEVSCGLFDLCGQQKKPRPDWVRLVVKFGCGRDLKPTDLQGYEASTELPGRSIPAAGCQLSYVLLLIFHRRENVILEVLLRLAVTYSSLVLRRKYHLAQ